MDEVSINDFNRDINNYILINNKFYRRLSYDRDKLNPVNVEKSHLTGRFGLSNRILEQVPELEGFCCEPGHEEKFRPIVQNKWNMYHRVNWNAKEGEWPTIRQLLTHLYGANGVEPDQLEEIFDYHTIMMRWPKQKLFGRVLYSHEQGTSKSALAVLEQLMFDMNYIKIRSEEFDDTDNSYWADKLILHLDEPSFKTPIAAARKLRDLITTPIINKRRMYSTAEPQPFHAKILITTNDTDFMTFEQSDRRYWIREIPQIPVDKRDPNFNQKMKRECAHYIHFLQNREMKYPKAVDGTFWLPQTCLSTLGSKKLVRDNISDVQQEIVLWFESYFLQDRAADHIKFTIRDLIARIDWEGKQPSSRYVGKVLRDGLKLIEPERASRLKDGDNYITKGSDHALSPQKFYRANRSQFDLDIDVFDVKL